ncbi:flavin reductase family protein [Deefgea tanakiae]|jgi:flavin reductase (DIM6/NTAB) family NADH-FMN oxidoreductase RutF|uniref:Flavin reductase family protein n=1 Tax=Deefgea tanakiae TaxID=2865840 RepID=A0ABX8Z5M6_9NEIS|nr:flavin reductase family protein [Deefgea tanakiae]QZA76485.1 flavin reductase family protein [Deefgea tanakiae]
MEWPVSALTASEKYTLITDCVVPRPIAWVSSVDVLGKVNIAPFSYFNIVSSDPLIVSLSVNRRMADNGCCEQKDTALNLLSGGDCVIHIPSHDHAPAVHATGSSTPPSDAQIDALGLQFCAAQAVKTPRIQNCAVALEGRLLQNIEVGNPVVADLILVEIVHIFAADDLMHNGHVHPEPYSINAMKRT